MPNGNPSVIKGERMFVCFVKWVLLHQFRWYRELVLTRP